MRGPKGRQNPARGVSPGKGIQEIKRVLQGRQKNSTAFCVLVRRVQPPKILMLSINFLLTAAFAGVEYLYSNLHNYAVLYM